MYMNTLLPDKHLTNTLGQKPGPGQKTTVRSKNDRMPGMYNRKCEQDCTQLNYSRPSIPIPMHVVLIYV